MADLYVRDPKTGEVVVIDDSQQQLALDQGYQPVDEAGRQATQQAEISTLGDQEAVTQGLLTAPEGYESQAAKEKLYSAATFGLLPGLDSAEARARGLRFQAEHPGEAFAYEVAGQLPLAVAGGALGEAAVAAGAAAKLGRAAQLGVRAADFGAQAALGGAQTEAEQTRLAADDFSWTDAAVAGVAGEALGRGAGWAVSRAVGGTRNLLAKAEREAIADEVDDSLQKGGWLNDFRVAHHAEQYQNELADLAARDLDELQVAFEEVSRQDRKRARIARVVEDAPEAQVPIRIEAHAGLQQLRDAVAAEVGEAPSGAAKSLLKQIDDRIEQLEDPARTGRRLWRTLDENRQALQEFQQDLHQAYENNPGSAWLSRDGLAAVDAAERQTREALLREDAWGKAAAEAQAAYNTPFHAKYFPTEKTVKGKLMFSPYKNERGFDVFQGDPAKVRAFFARDVGDVDGARLGEQFRDYLDGVEAIARAGEADAPQAARKTMEAVRRLRKAAANAEYIAQAARRTGERAKVVELGAEVAGAGAATAAAGPFAGAAAFGALRGARAGDWVFRAARRLGWGAGEAQSMAKLLSKGELPAVAGRDRTVQEMLDDLVEGGGRSGPPAPPSGGPSGAPPAPGGGLGPAPRSGPPTAPPSAALEPLDVGIFSDAPTRPTAADELGPSEAPPSAAPAERPTRFVGEREVNRGQAELLETEPVAEAGMFDRRQTPRLEALRAELEAQARGVLESIRAAAPDDALAARFADDLEANLDELVDDELALAADRAERALAPTEAPPAFDAPAAGPTLDDISAFYLAKAEQESPDLARFLEKAGEAVQAGQAKAKDWWEQALADTAPKEDPGALPGGLVDEAAPAPAAAGGRDFKQALRDKYGASEPPPIAVKPDGAFKGKAPESAQAELEKALANPKSWTTSELRPESLDRIKASPEFASTGEIPGAPLPRLFVDDSGVARLEDGNHRLAAALEKGVQSFKMRVIRQGASGRMWVWEGSVPLGAAYEPAGGLLARKIGRQGGVTAGGFYEGSDGVVRYVKFADRAHQLTELANNQVYRDWGVLAVDQKLVPLARGEAEALKKRVPVGAHSILDREANPVALTSEKLPEQWRPVEGLLRSEIKPEAVREYIRGVPADIVLGNWDIAENPGNILTDGARVLRLDAGEAGANSLFEAQAKPLWQDFVNRIEGGRLADAPAAELSIPAQLTETTAVKDAKAALVEGIDAIEAVVNQHGSFGSYVADRFSHLDPARQKALAQEMAKRFDFLKENIDSLAGLALFVGASALSSKNQPDEAGDGAQAAQADGSEPAAAGAGPLGGFAAAAALFKQGRGRLVRNVARALFSAAPEATLKTVARLAYSRAQLAARQEEFQAWQANPQELVDRVAEGLAEAPPEAYAKAAQGVFAAASFLREKLPQSSKPSPVGLSGAPVSSEAAAKYARYEQAALRPREALREAGQVGYLSPELLETLQTLYPDLLAEVRVEAYQAIRETPHPTVQARTTYARLFDGDGALADPAFSATAVQMANLAFQQASEASPPKTGAGPRPGVSQTAAAVQAPAPYRTA